MKSKDNTFAWNEAIQEMNDEVAIDPVPTTSANRRKFRVWDNSHLINTYAQVSQIKEKIDELLGDREIEDLPLSAVQSDVLYSIVVCYMLMFDKLLDENLLNAGYPKSKSTNQSH